VLRVQHSGEIEEVTTKLNVPTGMTFGADGRLYISDLGAVPAPMFGVGRILRLTLRRGGEVRPGSAGAASATRVFP
jgi:hypothetical protein